MKRWFSVNTFSASRIRRGAMLFGASRMGALGLGLASNVLLVHVAPPLEVASYLLLVQSIVATVLIVHFGLGTAALRFVPLCRGRGGRRQMKTLRKKLLGIQALLILVSIPILMAIWPWICFRLNAPALSRAAILLVAAAGCMSFNLLMDAYLRAVRAYAVSAFLSEFAVRCILVLGFLGIAFLYRGQATWDILAGLFLGANFLITVLYSIAFVGLSTIDDDESRDAHVAPGMGEIMRTSLTMGLRDGISILLVSCDLWIISWCCQGEDVAVYGVTLALLRIVTAFPNIANQLIPQEFSLLHVEKRHDELEKLARSSATVVATVNIVILLGLVLAGKPLIQLVFGETYAAGFGILLILAFGRLFDAVCGSAGYLLQMTGHHYRLLLLTLGTAVFNLVLSVGLAPIWGGYGVATATTMSLVLVNICMVYSARHNVGIRTFVFVAPREWYRLLYRLVGKRFEVVSA